MAWMKRSAIRDSLSYVTHQPGLRFAPFGLFAMSVTLPWENSAEQPTEAGVHRAVQGPQVRKVVGAAEDGRDNVVDFSTVR